MKTTLVLETSTDWADIALFEGDTLRLQESFGAGRRHSALLFAVLEKHLPPSRRLDHIIVGLGPGSYAGVRIAIAAATGLALATGAALSGIPSVAGLGEGDYIALGDARRGSTYFAHIRGGEGVEDGGPRLVEAGELAALLARPEYAQLPLYASEPLPECPRPVEIRQPQAERLGRLALAGKNLRETMEPIYLREAMITLSKKTPPPFPGH